MHGQNHIKSESEFQVSSVNFLYLTASYLVKAPITYSFIY